MIASPPLMMMMTVSQLRALLLATARQDSGYFMKPEIKSSPESAPRVRSESAMDYVLSLSGSILLTVPMWGFFAAYLLWEKLGPTHGGCGLDLGPRGPAPGVCEQFRKEAGNGINNGAGVIKLIIERPRWAGGRLEQQRQSS